MVETICWLDGQWQSDVTVEFVCFFKSLECVIFVLCFLHFLGFLKFCTIFYSSYHFALTRFMIFCFLQKLLLEQNKMSQSRLNHENHPRSSLSFHSCFEHKSNIRKKKNKTYLNTNVWSWGFQFFKFLFFLLVCELIGWFSWFNAQKIKERNHI